MTLTSNKNYLTINSPIWFTNILRNFGNSADVYPLNISSHLVIEKNPINSLI